jgi:fructose-bisphosphate aldolase class II
MIHRKLPNTHRVMHGSSSVPDALQEIINRYGSQMTPAMAAPTKL